MPHSVNVIPANNMKRSVFGHQTFPRLPQGSNPVPLAPEASTLTTKLPRFIFIHLKILHYKEQTVTTKILSVDLFCQVYL